MAAIREMGLADGYLSLVDALSAIRQLSELDLSSTSESLLLEAALGTLIKHQDLENCSLFLLRDDRLVCAAGTGLGQYLDHAQAIVRVHPPDSMSFAIGEGVIGRAFEEGRILVCDDCDGDPDFRPFPSVGVPTAVGSLVCVPVRSGETVLGVLNVSHPLKNFFQSWHQHFLVLYANCLGRFLHVHRHLKKLEEIITDRTSELQSALAESEDLRRQYQRLSTLDELTGLRNRRYFFTEGEAMLSRSLREQATTSLIMIDVDHFKRINDNWGHAVGDRVLKLIADVLRKQLRIGDMIARLGGEEFVLLLPNTGPVAADMIAGRIQDEIGKIDLGGTMEGLKLTASIGMTFLPGETRGNLTELLQKIYKEADAAMYTCKNQGRNCRLFFVPEMDNGPPSPQE